MPYIAVMMMMIYLVFDAVDATALRGRGVWSVVCRCVYESER